MKSKLILPAFLIMLLCAIASNAQVQVKEQIGDEYIVVIEGREYRAITADQARAIIAAREHTTRIERELALRVQEVEQLKLALAAADSVCKVSDDRANLLDAKVQKQDAIIGNLQFVLNEQSKLIGRRSFTDKLFDNPVMKFTVNLGLPTLQSWLAARRH